MGRRDKHRHGRLRAPDRRRGPAYWARPGPAGGRGSSRDRRTGLEFRRQRHRRRRSRTRRIPDRRPLPPLRLDLRGHGSGTKRQLCGRPVLGVAPDLRRGRARGALRLQHRLPHRHRDDHQLGWWRDAGLCGLGDGALCPAHRNRPGRRYARSGRDERQREPAPERRIGHIGQSGPSLPTTQQQTQAQAAAAQPPLKGDFYADGDDAE